MAPPTCWSNNPTTPSSSSALLASIRSYLLLVLALLLIGEQTTQALQVNAWTPCSTQTTARSSMDPVAECTTAVVPLCYADVCGAPERSSTKTITLSLKRILAKSNASSAAASRPRNVWVIPDRSDVVLPSEANDQMERLYRQLGGEVSVCTLDQRGTGQSTRLSCNKSLPSAATIANNSSLYQLHQCLQNLDAQYDGHLAAFSITSAAYDLVTLISQTQTKSDVVVYGLGYGTLVVERLLHLSVAEIKGYVLDGSATTSGAKQSDFAYFSNADADFGRVGDEFVSLCESSPTCSSKFAEGGNKSVSETLKGVLESVDRSRCATLWSNDDDVGSVPPASTDPGSYSVRKTLAMLMQNATERAFIPVVIYRLNRCSAHDHQVLRNLVVRLQERERELASHSELVYDLQAFSELWENESSGALPRQNTLVTRFTESLISPGRAVDQLSKYCVFAGDTTSEACAALAIPGSNSTRFTYAHDKYWNVGAAIPAHASVLLLNGKFDGQSSLKHASLLSDALQGSAKKLLVFEALTHNVVANQETSDEKTSCGLEILGTYILNSGVLDALNTTCIKQLPPVNFQIADAMSLRVLNVTDAYDGSFSASSRSNASSAPAPVIDVSSNGDPSTSEKRISSLKSSRERYKVAFIVVLTLLVLVLLAAIVVLYRWRKRKQLKHEEDQLRQMRGEEVDDLEQLRHIYLSSPEAWANEYAMFGNERRSGARSNEAQKASSAASARPSIHTENNNNGNSSSEESKSPPCAWIYRSTRLDL